MMGWEDTSYNELNRGALGRLAYSAGPVAIGTAPTPANLFSGYWSAFYDAAANTVRVQPISNVDVDVSNPYAGTSYPYFPTLQNPNRATNLSLAFDNRGDLIFGIQDNATTPPTIRVAGSGGGITANWTGYNPMVFNGVEMTTGHYASGFYSNAISGAVGCLYTDAANTRLYARYLADNFAQEYTFTLGGTTGYFLWLAGGMPAVFGRTFNSGDPIALYEWAVEDALAQVGFDLVAYEYAVWRLTGISLAP
jgi:hypothetical protein